MTMSCMNVLPFTRIKRHESPEAFKLALIIPIHRALLCALNVLRVLLSPRLYRRQIELNSGKGFSPYNVILYTFNHL
jgi:hypothetical protein